MALGPKEAALRALKEARLKRPNPFEDAARGRDPVPKSSRGEESGKLQTPAPRKVAGSAAATLHPAGVASSPQEARKAAARSDVLQTVGTTVSVRGRPKLEEKRAASSKPWVKEGMSRASWYRRQKLGKGKS